MQFGRKDCNPNFAHPTGGLNRKLLRNQTPQPPPVGAHVGVPGVQAITARPQDMTDNLVEIPLMLLFNSSSWYCFHSDYRRTEIVWPERPFRKTEKV